MQRAAIDATNSAIRPLRRASALTCALLLSAPACGPKDGETATTAASESSSTTGSTTGATDAGPTTGSTAGTGEGSSTGEPPPPVECEGVTCSAGQLCLWPPSVCDYNQTPPAVTRGGKKCADFPATCEGVTDGLAMCLSEALCTNSVLHEGTSYEMGLLDCFPAWNDCF